MSDLRSAFVEAADHVIAIVARDDVSVAWREPSALADWSVGGLVAHFAGQLPTVLRLLQAEPGADPIAVDEHYHRSAWVSAGHDAEVNTGIRQGGERDASMVMPRCWPRPSERAPSCRRSSRASRPTGPSSSRGRVVASSRRLPHGADARDRRPR